VARDGRIRTGDVILKVNTTDTVDVPHQVAVDALKSSGSVVRLVGGPRTSSHSLIAPFPILKLVKRQKPPLATVETFRSPSVDPLSRVSPSGLSASNFGNSPPVPGHQQQQPAYLSDPIRELEQRPGVRKMELIKVGSRSDRSRMPSSHSSSCLADARRGRPFQRPWLQHRRRSRQPTLSRQKAT
jgi:hypothetical protein